MSDLMWEPCRTWPKADEPGIYRIACSCGKWEATGTVAEINVAAIWHDDSPWLQHVVSIRWVLTR